METSSNQRQTTLCPNQTVVGVLLAAGRGRRFDPEGKRNKLMQLLPDQTPVVLQSLRTLRQAVDAVVAVVAPGAEQVHALLHNEGVQVVVCETADDGMAESLKAGLQASLNLRGVAGGNVPQPAVVRTSVPASMQHAITQPVQASTPGLCGWLVALADMPFIHVETLLVLAHALREGARVAVPMHNGKRGNPVVFSQACLPELMALTGDAGARSLLGAADVVRINVNDPGILRDIDTPQDLVTPLK